MKGSKLYSFLAIMGTLPFLGCAILLLLGIDTLEPVGRLDILASTYGLGVIGFLAGAHWATYLYKEYMAPLNLFVSSNVVFLAVWFTFVIESIGWILLIQLLAFLLLLFIDYRLLLAGLISNHYFNVRLVATALATISLLLILLAA